MKDGKRVYLFVGEADHLKDEALRELKKSLLEDASAELNFSLFYGGEASAKEIIGCASTVPFLSRRRLVVVKKPEKLNEEDKKLLADYAARPQETTCLVLDTTDESILEIFSSPGSHIEIVRFDKVQDFKLSGWIKGILRSMGKTPDDEAVELLRELFEKNQGILRMELEKLVSFVGRRAEIKLEDVENVVDKGFISTTFELTDAIGSREASKALRILQGLLNGPRPRYGDNVGAIVGAIAWHLKRLRSARVLFEKEKSEFAVKNSLKIPKRLQDCFMAQVKRIETKEISKRLEMLLEADLDIKAGRMDAKTSLETVVVKLCLS